MTYNTFRTRFAHYPVISARMLKAEGVYGQGLKVQLARWVQAEKIVRLRKGLYLLNARDRIVDPSRMYYASEMYGPSYVSLEYALSWYGLIPERTTDVTSVTTRKTMLFYTVTGTFRYQHVKPECFTGFSEQKDEEGLPFLLAFPEKALVDLIYLNLRNITDDPARWMRESLRLQNTGQLSKARLAAYVATFGNRRLTDIFRQFMEDINA